MAERKHLKYERAYRERNRERLKKLKREWRAKNVEKARASRRAYSVRYPERIRAYEQGWREEIPGKKFAQGRRDLLKKYGLDQEAFDRLLVAQNGVCAICRRPESQIRKSGPKLLDIDHHHETGRVRALLCNLCNRAIGLMQEDPARLRAAADYLEKHSHDEDE